MNYIPFLVLTFYKSCVIAEMYINPSKKVVNITSPLLCLTADFITIGLLTNLFGFKLVKIHLVLIYLAMNSNS